MPNVGDTAPPVRLPSSAGGTRDLKELRGNKVVLYFYPKDDTPGCTREACEFRDNMEVVRAAGAIVIGISKDSLATHDRFKAKYRLPFELLTDANNAAAERYGAYGEKTLYGRKFMGTIRSTFLIDEKGKLEAIWSPVKVEGHVDNVLAALRGEAPEPASAQQTPVVSAAAGSSAKATKAGSAGAANKATKKKATKKKAAKKKATKKKATKKKATKKKAAKKKATKKKAAKKKATKKKATKKKAAKKKATKKKATKKKATKKKATKKKKKR